MQIKAQEADLGLISQATVVVIFPNSLETRGTWKPLSERQWKPEHPALFQDKMS